VHRIEAASKFVMDVEAKLPQGVLNPISLHIGSFKDFVSNHYNLVSAALGRLPANSNPILKIAAVDVEYYIRDHVDRELVSLARHVLVPIQFYSVYHTFSQGSYTLLDGEATIVVKQANVSMETRGNSDIYSHGVIITPTEMTTTSIHKADNLTTYSCTERVKIAWYVPGEWIDFDRKSPAPNHHYITTCRTVVPEVEVPYRSISTKFIANNSFLERIVVAPDITVPTALSRSNSTTNAFQHSISHFRNHSHEWLEKGYTLSQDQLKRHSVMLPSNIWALYDLKVESLRESKYERAIYLTRAQSELHSLHLPTDTYYILYFDLTSKFVAYQAENKLAVEGIRRSIGLISHSRSYKWYSPPYYLYIFLCLALLTVTFYYGYRIYIWYTKPVPTYWDVTYTYLAEAALYGLYALFLPALALSLSFEGIKIFVDLSIIVFDGLAFTEQLLEWPFKTAYGLGSSMFSSYFPDFWSTAKEYTSYYTNSAAEEKPSFVFEPIDYSGLTSTQYVEHSDMFSTFDIALPGVAGYQHTMQQLVIPGALVLFILMFPLIKYLVRKIKICVSSISFSDQLMVMTRQKIFEHKSTVKVNIPITSFSDLKIPDRIKNFKIKDVKDPSGTKWTEGPVFGNETQLSRPVYSLSETQHVFTPAGTMYNYVVALQQRTLKDTDEPVNLKSCVQMKKVMQAVLKLIDAPVFQSYSMDNWVTERQAKGKNDRPMLQKYLAFINGDSKGYEDEFDLYTFENHKPKNATSRFKLHEKFLDEEIKPRIYDVFHPLHAILTGPVHIEIARIFLECIPGYCDGVSLPELKDKINHSLDEIDMIQPVTELGFLCCDGSKFDSTQHYELMQLIRTPVIKALFDGLLEHYEDLTLTPDQLYLILTNYVTKHKF